MSTLVVNGKTIDITRGESLMEDQLDADGLLDVDPAYKPEDDLPVGGEDEIKDLGLAYLFKAAGFLPGESQPSPNPNATRLREYWVHGEGAAKIRWGEPHDFDRCVMHLGKFVGDRAKGLCNIYHREALGVAPGQEGKSRARDLLNTIEAKASASGGGGGAPAPAPPPMGHGGAWDPNKHPRVPKGSPMGGKFTNSNSSSQQGNSGVSGSAVDLSEADIALIKQYQKDSGLPQTGQLDAATLAQARRDTMGGPKKGKKGAKGRGAKGGKGGKGGRGKAVHNLAKRKGAAGTKGKKSKASGASQKRAAALHNKTHAAAVKTAKANAAAAKKAAVAKAQAAKAAAKTAAAKQKAITARAKAAAAQAKASQRAAARAQAQNRQAQRARWRIAKPLPRIGTVRNTGIRRGINTITAPTPAPTKH